MLGGRTGYVICNIDRAAAASSPHMISLSTTPSGACSSVRRMGRPTMEGYWWSGKFCAYYLSDDRNRHLECYNKRTVPAYPALRKPVPPSRTMGGG